jgi:transmembrane sensor
MNPPSSPDPSGPLSSAVAIEDAALAWLAERDDGFSPAREREFAHWQQNDSRHAAAVARLQQTLGLLNQLPQFRVELNTEFNRAAPVVPFPPFPSVQAGSPAAVTRRSWRVGAWAGAVAILTLGIAIGWRALHIAPTVRYTTTAAGYERARLNDGSTLELNAASAVRVSFSAAERHVELEAGEAHFAVAPDAARPFVVTAGDILVRAVGTAFNVRFSTAGVEVIVVEGKVEVGKRGPDSFAAAEAPLVAAGERIMLPNEAPAPAVEKISPAALRQALAWQARMVEFADAPLAEVVTRFNARNRVQVFLADAELGAERIGGSFALNEVEAFVRLLERDGEILAERRGEAEILLRRRP